MVNFTLLYFSALILSLPTLTYSLRLSQHHLTVFSDGQFQHNLQHVLHTKASQNGHESQIPQKVFNDLKDFVSNDTEITNRIHAQKPLSKSSADKVKGYFLQDKEFEDFTIDNLVSSTQNPKCLDGISETGRDKLYKILLDQLDFSTIFLSDKPDQQFTQQQVIKIITKLKADKQLRKYMQRCFGKQKQ